MRLRIDRDQLADAVAWVARCLSNRPTVPVLGGVVIEAAAGSGVVDGGRLRLSTFDYELCAQAGAEAAIAEPGSALVPGRLLAEIARGLPPEPVDLHISGAHMVLVCGGFEYTMLTMPVEDYPALPPMPPQVAVLGSDTFAAAIAQVTVAAGRDQTLPLLTTVRLADAGELVSFGCTDRYRIAVRQVPWRRVDAAPMPVALVPARALADAAKALHAAKTRGAEVCLGLDESRLGVECGGRRLISRLVDVKAPDYDARMPTVGAWRAEVATGLLVEAVKRVSLVAAPHTPLRLSFTAGAVRLAAATGEEAKAAATLPVTLHGDDISVAFKPQFLLDGLVALDSDLATMTFTDPNEPVLLTGKFEGDGDAGFRYLTMPLRL
jgi:DNA polymerase-3 subunit beta